MFAFVIFISSISCLAALKTVWTFSISCWFSFFDHIVVIFYYYHLWPPMSWFSFVLLALLCLFSLLNCLASIWFACFHIILPPQVNVFSSCTAVWPFTITCSSCIISHLLVMHEATVCTTLPCSSSFLVSTSLSTFLLLTYDLPGL